MEKGAELYKRMVESKGASPLGGAQFGDRAHFNLALAEYTASANAFFLAIG